MNNKKTVALKRVIVDYKKLDNRMLDLLVEKFPDGYDEDDIVTYRNANNEVVECIEVRTEDTAYLIKVSKRLVMAMEDHEEPEEEGDSDEETSLDTEDLEDSEEE